MRFDDREEMEALAGEYVLGVLSSSEAAEIERAMQTNRELRRAVYTWENRLVALTSSAAPIPPDATLWARIERVLPAQPRLAPRPASAAAAAKPGIWSSLAFWRFSGLAGFAATAVLLWFAFIAPPLVDAPPAVPSYTAVLQAPDKSAGYLVQADQKDGVRLIPLVSTSPAPDKALQFWTKQQSAKGPTSLGVVAPNEVIRIPAERLPGLEADQLFEITLEPAGGSPIDRPTGAILFVGRTVKSI